MFSTLGLESELVDKSIKIIDSLLVDVKHLTITQHCNALMSKHFVSVCNALLKRVLNP